MPVQFENYTHSFELNGKPVFAPNGLGRRIGDDLKGRVEEAYEFEPLLTQVRVDPDDPAFASPTKFVGPVYDRDEAERVAERHKWSIAQDGEKWRRVVPSPAPIEIPDLKVIRLLLLHGTIVICAGGGGIPVIENADGALTGVEAVIDKDATSALLAEGLGADALLLLTDVDGVYKGFSTDAAERIAQLTPQEAAALDLPAGSMAPKVTAGAQFARGGQRWTGIGKLSDALAIIEGRSGTRIAAS